MSGGQRFPGGAFLPEGGSTYTFTVAGGAITGVAVT